MAVQDVLEVSTPRGAPEKVHLYLLVCLQSRDDDVDQPLGKGGQFAGRNDAGGSHSGPLAAAVSRNRRNRHVDKPLRREKRPGGRRHGARRDTERGETRSAERHGARRDTETESDAGERKSMKTG